MRRINEFFGIVIVMCLTLASSALAQDQYEPDSQRPVVVGRISYITGQLLRYVPDEKDWVATVKDAPFGLNDALYSGDDSQAEFIIPNGAWMRIGDNTQIQLIAVEDDVTEADIAEGMARFYNKSDTAVMKATTPFGYVLAPAGASFDLYVGDNSLEVISLSGKVDFIHAGGDAKFPVIAGEPSILADTRQVTSGEGTVDADWDSWNNERDHLWEKRMHERGDSATYLPERLHDDAYVLDEYGRWERVYYDGEYRQFWRPVRVSSGWAPFTHGHWTVWYDDNCWIPEEPFGYVTHHYGNWVYMEHYWYWSPPLARVEVAVEPGLAIGFGWYPGRVAWIHSGTYVGWVPLAPSEPYYCHRYWGRRSHPVSHTEISIISVDRYSYFHQAVIINQTNLYRVTNYNSVRVNNIKHINKFHAAPVVNNTVVNNYNIITNKYNFTNAPVNRKPHEIVTQRIQRNEQAARQSENLTRNIIEHDSVRMKTAEPVRGGKVENPMGSNKLVAPDAVRKPESEVKFSHKQVKGKAAVKPVVVQPNQAAPAGRLGYPEPEARQPGQKQEPPVHQQPQAQEPSVRDQTQETKPPINQHPPVEQPSSAQRQKGPQPQLQERKQEPEQQPSTPQSPQIKQPSPEKYRKKPQSPAEQYPSVEQPSSTRYRKGPQPPVQERQQGQQPSGQESPQTQQPSAKKSKQAPKPNIQEQPREIQPPVQPQPAMEPPSSPQRRKESPPPVQQRRQEQEPSMQEQPPKAQPSMQQYPQVQQPSPKRPPQRVEPPVHLPQEPTPSERHYRQVEPPPSRQAPQPSEQQVPTIKQPSNQKYPQGLPSVKEHPQVRQPSSQPRRQVQEPAEQQQRRPEPQPSMPQHRPEVQSPVQHPPQEPQPSVQQQPQEEQPQDQTQQPTPQQKRKKTKTQEELERGHQ